MLTYNRLGCNIFDHKRLKEECEIQIRELRERQGLSQEELAERVGCHANTIRRWELGYREPRSSDIHKLCEVLNCTEAELLNGPDNKELEVRIIMGGDTVSNLPRIDLKPNEFIYQLKNNEPLVSLMGCIRIGTPEERQKAREEILKNYDALCLMYEQKEKAGV